MGPDDTKRLCTPEKRFGLGLVNEVLQDDGSDPERTRALRLSLFNALGMPITGFFFLRDLYLGAIFSPIILLSTTLLIFASNWTLKRHNKSILGSYLLIAAETLLLGTVHTWEGGIESPSLWAVPLIPMTASLLLGIRAALGCSALATLTIFVAIACERWLDLSAPVDDSMSNWLLLRCAILVLFVSFGFLASNLTRNLVMLLHSQNQDIQRATQRIQGAIESRQSFFANISHEIRTPLNGILGMTSMLEREELSPVIQQNVALMKSCGERLLATLTDILDLSKIEATREKEHAELSLADHVEKSLARVQKRLCATKIPLDLCLGGDGPKLSLDIRAFDKLIELVVRHARNTAESGGILVSSHSGSIRATALGDGLRERLCIRYLAEQGPREDTLLRSSKKDFQVLVTLARQLCNQLGATLVKYRDGANNEYENLVIRFCEDRAPCQTLDPPAQRRAIRFKFGPQHLIEAIANRMILAKRSDRAILLSVFQLIFIFGCSLYLVEAVLNDHFLGFALHGCAFVVVIYALYLNMRKGWTVLSAQISAATCFVDLGFMSFADGQIYSECLWFLGLVPIGTSYILGNRAMLTFTLACLAHIVGVYLIHMRIELPQEYEGGFYFLVVSRLIALYTYAGVLISATYLSNIFEQRQLHGKRRLESMLASATAENKTKAEFFAEMSHEIRTPMNGILGMSEWLVAQPMPESQHQAARTVHRCGGHLLALLSEVLDVATTRLEAPAPCVPIDLDELVHDIAHLFEASARLRGISIEVQGLSAPFYTQGDQTALIQVLSNLVSNALKFSDAGTVLISVERTEGTRAGVGLESLVNIRVKDQGIGMAPEQIPTLFEDYVQLDQDGGNVRGGTGLGLAISQRLIKTMGGTIDVKSRLGEGSVFTVSLWMPCLPEPVTVSSDESSLVPLHEHAGRKLHVLVVDDNVVNRKVAVASLERLSFTCEVACDGQEALKLAQSQPFDVILMDVRMPVMDGLEATRKIRAEPGPCQQVPILALTADNYEEHKDGYLAAGMTGGMSKPFRLQDLQERLAEATSGAQAA